MSVAQKSKRERGYDSSKGYKRGFRNKMKTDGAFDGRFKNRVEADKKKTGQKKACRMWDWRDELDIDIDEDLDELESVEELPE
jgi:hypothetical protein